MILGSKDNKGEEYEISNSFFVQRLLYIYEVSLGFQRKSHQRDKSKTSEKLASGVQNLRQYQGRSLDNF